MSAFVAEKKNYFFCEFLMYIEVCWLVVYTMNLIKKKVFFSVLTQSWNEKSIFILMIIINWMIGLRFDVNSAGQRKIGEKTSFYKKNFLL